MSATHEDNTSKSESVEKNDPTCRSGPLSGKPGQFADKQQRTESDRLHPLSFYTQGL